MSYYKKVGTLGSGGYADVELCIIKIDACFAKKGTKVAVKRVHSDITQAKKEANILEQLDNRFIVRFFDEFYDDVGFYCIAMEYCDHGTLQDWLTSVYKPLEEYNIWRLVWQFSTALSYLHGQKPPLLHNDLKPANILCKTTPKTGRIDIKIADFGICDTLARSPSCSYYHADPIGYTWKFSAPEIVIGVDSHITTSADMWSLGVILTYISNDGEPPFIKKEDILSWTGASSPISREFNFPYLHELVLSLLNTDKHLRPSAEQVLKGCQLQPERFQIPEDSACANIGFCDNGELVNIE